MVTLATPQLSPVTGVPRLAMVAPHLPASFGTLHAIGAVMRGFSLSTTVTVKLHIEVPHRFDAVMVTVVVPRLNTLPLPLPVPFPVVAPLNV